MVLLSLWHLETLSIVPSAGSVYNSSFIIEHPAWTCSLLAPAVSHRVPEICVWFENHTGKVAFVPEIIMKMEGR